MADKFTRAVEIVNGLPKEGPVQPTNDDKLEFYACYKQATIGNVNTDRPGMLDFAGKAKWDAWNGRKDTTEEENKKAYVAKLISLLEKHPNDGDNPKYLAELK